MHYCALSASRIFRSGATIWTHSLLSLVNDRAVTIADELGIEHLDLMSVLTPSLENYYDFTHFTPAGARVVAEALARFFLRLRGDQLPRTILNPTGGTAGRIHFECGS